MLMNVAATIAESEAAKNAERIEHAYSTTMVVTLMRRMTKMISKHDFHKVKSVIAGIINVGKFDFTNAVEQAVKYRFALGGLKTNQ